jgi:hypothetical protein
VGEQDEKPEESLCTECGLCCDGTLFGRVSVIEEEIAGLAALGLGIDETGKAPGFSQPCPMFGGQLCAIYEKRPGACRRFACKLLAQGRAGLVPWERAHAIVVTARELKARAAAHGPAQPEKESEAGAAAAMDRDAARASLDRVALSQYLQRHFRRAPKGAKNTGAGGTPGDGQGARSS